MATTAIRMGADTVNSYLPDFMLAAHRRIGGARI